MGNWEAPGLGLEHTSENHPEEAASLDLPVPHLLVTEDYGFQRKGLQRVPGICRKLLLVHRDERQGIIEYQQCLLHYSLQEKTGNLV